MMLTSSLILIFFMLFGNINWIASVVMITVYCFYMWILIKSQRKHADEKTRIAQTKPEPITKNPENQEEPKKDINKKSIAFVVMGLIGLIVGCRLLVYSGVELAHIVGIPEMIMGLFTLAIGTSIPELVVTLSSAMKGLHDLSIGTVLGSNTFNIIIGIGIPALILSVPVETLSLTFDAPVMIFVTVLLMALIKMGKGKLNRVGGIILLVTYLVYAVFRIFVLG